MLNELDRENKIWHTLNICETTIKYKGHGGNKRGYLGRRPYGTMTYCKSIAYGKERRPTE